MRYDERRESIAVALAARRAVSKISSKSIVSPVMRFSRLLSALLAGFLACGQVGCVPYRVVLRPGVEGRVMDAEAQKPIAYARVTRQLSAHSQRMVHSSAKGRFRFRQIAEIRWQPVIPVMLSYRGNFSQDTLFIRASGYADRQIPLQAYRRGSASVDIGNVELELELDSK